MRIRRRKELGHYIVADPEICHGQLTFNGIGLSCRWSFHRVGVCRIASLVS